MGKSFDSITDPLRALIETQHMFFVGTAPLSDTGHVNISPKGIDTFRILTPNRVAYLDLTGSGNETSAHLLENGRITFMFCAFDGAPNIVRLFGTGRTVLPGEAEWDDLVAGFTLTPGYRQIIVGEIDLVRSSCGYAVPFYDYVGDRDTLLRWAEVKGDDGLAAYWQEINLCSLDGLPAPLAARTEKIDQES